MWVCVGIIVSGVRERLWDVGLICAQFVSGGGGMVEEKLNRSFQVRGRDSFVCKKKEKSWCCLLCEGGGLISLWSCMCIYIMIMV